MSFTKIFLLSIVFAIASCVFAADDKFYNYYEKGLEYMESGDYDRAIVELKSAYSLQFEDAKKKRTYGTKFIEYFPHRETGICHYYLEEYDNAKQELDLSMSYKPSDRAGEYLLKISSGITGDTEKRNQELAKLEEKKKQLALEQEKIEKDRLEREALAKKKEQERLEKEKRDQEEIARKEEELKQKMLKEQEQKEKEEREKEALALQKQKEELEKQKQEDERKRKAQEEREALALKKEKEAIQKEIEELEKKKSRLGSEKANIPLATDPIKITTVGSPLAVAIIPCITGSEEDSHIPNMIMEKLITNLVKKRRFKVIEREFLDKIMAEQSLGMTGIVDEQSAINAGKVIGAEAIIMAKHNEIEGFYHISTRLIDVETSETITANEITSRIDDIDRAVEKLSVMIVNEMPLYEGTVIKVDNDNVYLDIGHDMGVRKGNKFTLYRKGEEIKHPVSGEVMGFNVTPLGEAVAMNIQERMSIAKIVKQGSLKIGDKAVIK
ncbi:MAG TPA: CsgG/HfaB family protein [Clostridiales bacterium]|nr:CsgG/HfaB family protein [Clostridiales bacterium]